MTRAIVWKELREQGLIGLTLLVFGGAILAAAATFADPSVPGAGVADIIRYLGAGTLATLLLAVTAGTVCGGAMFAAEREAGTLGFLESLPVSRWQIWYAKVAAGSFLVFIEVAILLTLAASMGIVETGRTVVAISVYSLLAFVWGLYGSTIARTTLGSVGVAVPSAAFASLFYLAPLSFFFLNPRTNDLHSTGVLLYLALMFVTPVIGSAWQFTRLDRDRAGGDSTPPSRIVSSDDRDEPQANRFQPRPRSAQWGYRALLWLTLQQLWLPGLVLCAFAIVLGLALLVDSIQLVLVWPALALTAGVLAGVTAVVDEQSNGIARFWGEQRLPLVRFWLVKIAIHSAFAVLLAILLLLPSAVRAQFASPNLSRGSSLVSIFRSPLFDSPHLGSQAWKIVFLPLVYGFVAGHVCGLLFRKAVVAAGVAGLVGGTAAAFWIPSLLSGGVHAWQLWLPPLVILFTAYRLLRAWSSERLADRKPLLTLAGGVAAMVLAIAAGLGYRVVEVQDDPTSEDDIQYVAGLAPIDVNDSGRQMRSAAERFARASQAALQASDRPPPSRARGSVEERIVQVARTGWVDSDPELEFWLNKVYEIERGAGDPDEIWFIQAEKAGSEATVGLFEHPLRAGTTSSTVAQLNGARMGAALLAHGLQQQGQGRPEQFLTDLKTTLMLGRTLRNGSVISALVHGNEVTRAAISASNQWAIGIDNRSDLLRAAIRIWQADEPAGPFDPRPHYLAERYVMRDLAKAPSQWLQLPLTPPGRDREYAAPLIDLIGIAWSVPWERERTRRLLGIGFESGKRNRSNSELIRGRPGSNLFTLRGNNTPAEMIENDQQLRVHRRAIVLALAIRLYTSEKGTVPGTLHDLLTAGYLPNVPLDPYDDLPFRYRVSAGEVLTAPQTPALSLISTGTVAVGRGGPPPPPPPTKSPEPLTRTIASGQPLLWSVGLDRTDEGGRNYPTRFGVPAGGNDIVFVVPIAEAKKP
jgi:hypothetical protein